MTEYITPPWLEGRERPVPVPQPTSGRWYKGMPSPNRKGRPKGIVDRRSKITQALTDDGVAIARVVTEAALEGDLQACGIVLARIAPTLKPQADRVSFDFDPTAPIALQIEAVLGAIASGAVAPDVGQTIISALGTLAEARAAADLEARIVTLEARTL